jgi:hypothetical protein
MCLPPLKSATLTIRHRVNPKRLRRTRLLPLLALVIPIARAEFTFASLLQVPPALRGEPRFPASVAGSQSLQYPPQIQQRPTVALQPVVGTPVGAWTMRDHDLRHPESQPMSNQR